MEGESANLSIYLMMGYYPFEAAKKKVLSCLKGCNMIFGHTANLYKQILETAL